MKVDFSEPECIFPTQASKLSNVIGSSPVSSGTVQALGDDSAAVGSTSTSSPLEALGDDSAAVGSTSTSSPLQALGDDSAAVGSTSTSSPLQALGDDSAAVGSTSTSSPLQALEDDSVAVSSTSISSPLQVLRDDSATAGLISTSSPVQNFLFAPLPSFQSPVQDSSGCCASETRRSPLHSSVPSGFAPAVSSVSSAPTQAFGPTASGFGTFAGAPTPSRFWSMQDPVKASGPSQNLCKPASSPLFGDDRITSSTFLPFGVPASSVFGCPPASSSSNLFPPNPFSSSTNASVSSPFGFSPSITSVSSAPTQTFGPKAVFSLSTTAPSIFASSSVPDHSQKTNFATTQGNFSGPSFGCGFFPAADSGTTTFPSGCFSQPKAPSAFSFSQPNALFTGVSTHFPSSFSSSSTSFPGVSSSVQRPHEAAAVSSPPFRCTACGATSSSSASPNFTFNGATAPPSAAISLPWLFYPTSGFGTSSAAQVTSPAPFQGYILLPFGAMSLQ